MGSVLGGLSCNLEAGFRLAVFAPVRRLGFRIDVAQLLWLFALSALMDFISDWVRYGPDAYFSWYGAGNEIYSGGLLLLLSALLSVAFRQRALLLAIPVLALASYPAVLIALTLPAALLRWGPLPFTWAGPVEQCVLAWAVIVSIRTVAVALAPERPQRWLRAVFGGVLLALPIWLSPLIAPIEPWWQQPAMQGGLDPRYPSPAAEAVLSAQAELLDDALAAIDDAKPGMTNLYFVGFAGDGKEDVFRRDVLAAQNVMNERWGTRGRSIALINNPRTLLETPMATVTTLRTTLGEIGAAINPDEDVVMLYLASHGTREHTLEIALPPLDLVQLTPGTLRTLLDEAGIRWRIIVVSACYSGAYIDALEDEQTVVMTAARADRASFGCGHLSEGTYFGEALFQQGFAKANSVPEAFELAQRRVAEREAAAGHQPPSEPQLSIGSAIADKLRELDRGRGPRGPGRSV